jgi:hypothetical protein
MRISIVIEAVKRGKLVSKKAYVNFKQFAPWIEWDRNTPSICLLHEMKQTSSGNEIIGFADSIMHPGNFVRFNYKKMLPPLIDFYHHLTIIDIKQSFTPVAFLSIHGLQCLHLSSLWNSSI